MDLLPHTNMLQQKEPLSLQANSRKYQHKTLVSQLRSFQIIPQTRLRQQQSPSINRAMSRKEETLSSSDTLKLDRPVLSLRAIAPGRLLHGVSQSQCFEIARAPTLGRGTQNSQRATFLDTLFRRFSIHSRRSRAGSRNASRRSIHSHAHLETNPEPESAPSQLASSADFRRSTVELFG